MRRLLLCAGDDLRRIDETKRNNQPDESRDHVDHGHGVDGLDGAHARGWPIARIFHVEAEGDFSLASGRVRPLDGLPPQHDAVFHKTVHNAFNDTGLDRWLRGRGVRRVVISGIRTEQGCETTARVASDLGYTVDFVTDATLTFAMTHPRDGRRYDSEEIKARTELVLAGRFARIASVEDALADA